MQHLAEKVLQVADPQAAVRLSRWSADVDQRTVWQGVLIEALVSERTLARALLEVLAVSRVARLLVIVDQPILLLPTLHPHNAGTNEVRRDATCGTAPFDLILEVLRLSPRPDALQTEDVTAVRQDAKPLLAARLLQDHLQTYAADLVFGSLNGKRVLHVQLVLFDALDVVQPLLFLVQRIQTELAAQFAQFPVGIWARVQHTDATVLKVRT